MEDHNQPALRLTASRGTMWMAGARGAGQLAQLAMIALLARHLEPADFGIYALAQAVVGFSAIFTDLGLRSAVIYLSPLQRDHIGSAVALNVGSGLFMAGLTWSCSWPLQGLLRIPELGPVLRWLSLVFVISNSVVALALLERRFAFRSIAIIEVIAVMCGTVVGIGSASAGMGVWALVHSSLASAAAGTCAAWIAARRQAALTISTHAMRTLLRYAVGLVGYNAINYWARTADNLMIGAVQSAAALGFYTRAYALMLAPITTISQVIARIALPGLASIRSNERRSREAVLDLVAVTAATAVLAVAFAGVFADLVIQTLLGGGWSESVPLLRILALAAVPQPVVACIAVLYEATGNTKDLFRRGLLVTCCLIAGFGVGVVIAGAHGVAWAYVAVTWLTAPWTMSKALGYIGLPLTDVVSAVAREMAPISFAGVVALTTRVLSLHDFAAVAVFFTSILLWQAARPTRGAFVTLALLPLHLSCRSRS